MKERERASSPPETPMDARFTKSLQHRVGVCWRFERVAEQARRALARLLITDARIGVRHGTKHDKDKRSRGTRHFAQQQAYAWDCSSDTTILATKCMVVALWKCEKDIFSLQRQAHIHKLPIFPTHARTHSHCSQSHSAHHTPERAVQNVTA